MDFSFLTNRGVLDRDISTNDVAILSNHYNDNGYVDHKIDDPVLVRGVMAWKLSFGLRKDRSIGSARSRLVAN